MKFFSDDFFDNIACFLQSPLSTRPNFNDLEASFLYIASPHFIELSFYTTRINILLSGRRSSFLTVTKVVRASHCFEHSVAMRTKTINTEAVTLRLSACFIEAIDFATWSQSLKTGQDHTFKATGFLLLRCDSTSLWIEISPHLKTNGLGLTHRTSARFVWQSSPLMLPSTISMS